MQSNMNNIPEEEDEEEPAFDFWSDEGPRRFNEMLDEVRKGSRPVAPCARLQIL